ncbi:InlB B-repeat-containing protein [Alkalihalophilus lindianensis]|uniref:InlB B-repeat-containing protein n=1 Tax=Alkalihalophilus lindianensis TaxID=1630542 RepID=A0ABU3X993_9BACI|nr:tetratricopeptide repeat protein [Alkalihalophilus lindianensis]MDV2684446.1 InlB B-repeat-containing protein [Alkalihalophilus lindianensis]
MKRKKPILIIGSLIGVLVLAAILVMTILQDDPAMLTMEDAKQSFEERDYELCADMYQQLLDTEPTNTEARIGLSKCLVGLGQVEEAEQLLLEGMQLSPTEPTLYLHTSQFYLGQSEVVRALSLLNEGIERTNSETLTEAVQSIVSNISIESERSVVQVGFERPLQLMWKGNSGQSSVMEAEWTIADDSIGAITSGESGEVMFEAKEIGTATVIAETEYFTKEKDIMVQQQVVEELTFNYDEPQTIAIDEEIELSVRATDANGEAMAISPAWMLENNFGTLSSTNGSNTTYTGQEAGIEAVIVSYHDLNSILEIRIDGDQKTILTQTEGNGSILLSPQQDSYEVGTEVTVSAVPQLGWEFVEWEGDLSGSEMKQTITIEDSLTIKAIFSNGGHTLSVEKDGEGTILRSSLSSTFAPDESVTLTARADEGWTFDGWRGDVTSANASITFQLDSDTTVRAVFVRDGHDSPADETEGTEAEDSAATDENTYSLSLNTTGQGNVVTNKSGSTFQPGTQVAISAVPASGWRFVRWEGSASGSSVHTSVTMNGNRSVTAVFARNESNSGGGSGGGQQQPAPEQPKPQPEAPKPQVYSLSTSVVGGGSISGGGGSYKAGTSVTLTATPNDGWKFVGWGGAASGQSATTTVTMNQNRSVTANFERVTQPEPKPDPKPDPVDPPDDEDDDGEE